MSVSLRSLVVALLLHACAALPALDLSQWRLTFADEFNGTAIDTAVWSLGDPWGPETSGNTQAYLWDDCSEANGILRLKGERRAYKAYAYTSGALHSDGKFTQLFGYFEMRAKIPRGQGIWPAFWLLNHWGNPELDVMEVLGDRPDKVYMTQHFGGGQTQGTYVGPDYSAGYHTYGLEWNTSAVIWYIDGVERFRSTTNVPQVPLELIVTLQVGGDWPGMPDASTPFPALMDVDYVRAYQPGVAHINVAPSVSLTAPSGGASYPAGAAITLSASATDSDGSIARVEFYRGTTLIGTDTSAPYASTWTNAAAGAYILTAKAYDDAGASTTSSAVSVTVSAATTNQRPTVSWVTPTSGASFLPPASVHMTVNATDSDGSIAKVEFRANGALFHTEILAPYDFDWTGVAVGAYTVVARAYDDHGATTDSPAIAVYVGAGGGLRATYFDNLDFTGATVTRTDPTVAFDWGAGSPAAGIGPDTFSARWTGYLLAPSSEPCTFTTRSDDGVRLWVDGVRIIDDWTNHAAKDDSGAIALQANHRYAITLEYFENVGSALAQLSWSTPTRAKTIIPRAQLFSSATTADESESGGATALDAGGGGRCGIGAGLAALLALLLQSARLRRRS